MGNTNKIWKVALDISIEISGDDEDTALRNACSEFNVMYGTSFDSSFFTIEYLYEEPKEIIVGTDK